MKSPVRGNGKNLRGDRDDAPLQARRREGGATASLPADHRSTASTERRVQAMADGSPRSHHLSALQQLADGRTTAAQRFAPTSTDVIQGYFVTGPGAHQVEQRGSEELFREQKSVPTAYHIKDAPPKSIPYTLGYQVHPVDSSGVALRVSDDSTMAVNNTNSQPKEFYAIPGVVATANRRLDAVGSAFSLDNTTGNRIRAAGVAMNGVRPVNRAKAIRGEADRFSNLIEHVCIKMAGQLMGTGGERPGEVVLQAPGSTAEHTAPIRPGPTSDPKITRLSGYVAEQAEGNARATPAEAQAAMLGNDAIDANETARRYGTQQGAEGVLGMGLKSQSRDIGINEYARPEVGEGFAIYSNQAGPEGKTDFSRLNDQFEPVELKDVWGYHYAGVAARSQDGNDWVTLENYNRAPDLEQKVKVLQRDMIRRYADLLGAKAKTLAISENADPMELGNKFREMINLFSEKVGADSTLEYMRLMTAMKPENAWYFRMYGTHKGQSFHEQNAASEEYANPVTVRVRKQLKEVKQGARNVWEAEWKRWNIDIWKMRIAGSGLALPRLWDSMSREKDFETGGVMKQVEAAADRTQLGVLLAALTHERRDYFSVFLAPLFLKEIEPAAVGSEELNAVERLRTILQDFQNPHWLLG